MAMKEGSIVAAPAGFHFRGGNSDEPDLNSLLAEMASLPRVQVYTERFYVIPQEDGSSRTYNIVDGGFVEVT